MMHTVHAIWVRDTPTVRKWFNPGNMNVEVTPHGRDYSKAMRLGPYGYLTRRYAIHRLVMMG